MGGQCYPSIRVATLWRQHQHQFSDSCSWKISMKTCLALVSVLLAIFQSSPTNGRPMRSKPMQPFYRFGAFMNPADIKQAGRPARHPISEPVELVETTKKKKLSKSELVELNTAVEEELVPLVTKEIDMDQFVNIDFDPNHMFLEESPGVSHGEVVVVDFDNV